MLLSKQFALLTLSLKRALTFQRILGKLHRNAVEIIKKIKVLNAVIAQNQVVVEEISVALSTAEVTKLTEERNKLKKRLVDILTQLTG